MIAYLQIDGAVAVDVVHTERPLQFLVGGPRRRHVDGAKEFLSSTHK